MDIVQQHGGESCITHLANRQKGNGRDGGNIAKNDCETGGEDTVHLALGVHWKDFDGLIQCLDMAKEKAKEEHEMTLAVHGGVAMGVYPSGKKSGAGRGMAYPFRALCDGFLVFVAEHPEPIEQTPNVLVELGSTLLMSTRGLASAWAELKNLLERLGGYVLWSKVSRVDLCVDLPGVDVAEVVKLVLAGQSIGRAQDEAFYRRFRRWGGVQVGNGQVVLRVYDKAAEMRKKTDPTKQRLLENHRWGGPQETAMRVEFQVRREALKGMGIDGVADYFRNRAGLVTYLLMDWFRLTVACPDRENNRALVNLALSAAFLICNCIGWTKQ